MNIALQQLFNRPNIYRPTIEREEIQNSDLYMCMRFVLQYIEESEVGASYQDLYYEGNFDHMTLRKAIKVLKLQNKIISMKNRMDGTLYRLGDEDKHQLFFDFC